jgi:hypothetical protein
MCTDALEDEPECLPLLLIRARAQIALRRDLDAQADLRDIIRLDPQCGMAYRLLGELAARRDEYESAASFFREAVRLDPEDSDASDWRMIVDASLSPGAQAARSAVPAAAPERFPPATRRDPVQARLARGTQHPERIDRPVDRGVEATVDQIERARVAPRQLDEPQAQAQAQGEERPTRPFARGSERQGESWRTPVVLPSVRSAPLTLPHGRVKSVTAVTPVMPRPTLTGHPPTQPPAKPAPRLGPTPRTTMRPATPELPGFGEFLVATGVLTRERLRAAQAYQRSMKVQLSTAIITLGLATPQRIEWAAIAHRSELDRQVD